MSVGGAFAIAVAANDTTADVKSGAELNITGNFSATATHHGAATTTADSTATGGNATVGASIALAFVDDAATATTTRNIRADGNVSFGAHASGGSAAVAKASAAGAAADGTTADQQADKQTGPDKMVGESANTDSSGGGGSGVGLGAALAINVSTSSAIPSAINAITVIADDDGGGTGDLTLSTSNNMDASASADGSASSGTAIGAAVAINVATLTNRASVNSGATVEAHGVTVEAKMKSIDDGAGGTEATHSTGASATSGASGETVGVTGSFALNVVDTTTEAVLCGGSVTTIDGGDVTLTAENTSESTVEAKAKAGGNLGVGASFAINIVDNNTTVAAIEDEATLTGTVANGIGDVTLLATGSHEATTQASGGAGGPSGKTSVGGAFAIVVANNKTEATLGSHSNASFDELDITGNFSATANHHGAATTTADSSAIGSGVAVGASIALAFVDDAATATTTRDIRADGNVSFGAHASGGSAVVAKASAAGAAADGSSADDQANKQTGVANQKKKSGSNKAVGQSATTNDGSGGGGGVGLGAALAINVSSSSAIAEIPSPLTVIADDDGAGGGDLTLSTTNNMDATASADGSALNGTAIGVAVAINVATLTNRASVDDGATVEAHGVTVEAKMKSIDDGAGGTEATHSTGASATSGASGEKVGVAGSFALSVVDTTTEAVLRTGSTTTLGSGDLTITAENTSESTVEAKSNASGKLGVGASVALNIVDNNTATAAIENTAVLNGTHGNVTLMATGSHETTTLAAGGAGGPAAKTSVGGGVAIVVANNSTTATIGTGAALTGDGLGGRDGDASRRQHDDGRW